MSGETHLNKDSLFGMVSFRPRLAIVLVFLTLTVGVVGYHISRDSGIRRVEGLSKEAKRAFAASQGEGMAGPSKDPGEIENRIKDWVGIAVMLPRDERQFSYKGVTREKIGRKTGAAVRLAFAEEPYLLLIVRADVSRVSEPSGALFTDSSFLSWEKDGISYVFWEKEGVMYVLVSTADLTHTFDLVRQYFT